MQATAEHSGKYETKSLTEYTFWLDQYPDKAETRAHLHPKMYLQNLILKL